ncbi:hypothetical protein D3C81_441890 [compost metagenome]
MPQVEVIRIIKYVGEETLVRANLAKSLPDGIKELDGYEIHVATHSSNLPPLVELSAEAIEAALNKDKV